MFALWALGPLPALAAASEAAKSAEPAKANKVTKVAKAQADLAACDAPGPATLLSAETALPAPAGSSAASPTGSTDSRPRIAGPAQAVWLRQDLIQWPGARPEGSFRLYRSTGGTLALNKDRNVIGADARLTLVASGAELSPALAARFRHLANGPRLVVPLGAGDVRSWLGPQVWLVREDDDDHAQQVAELQMPGALDDRYRTAEAESGLGVSVLSAPAQTSFKLWAPTARQVEVCVHPSEGAPAARRVALELDERSGVWSGRLPADLSGQYYRYLVEVRVPGTGWVRNRVTDPYAVSLGRDSRLAYIADLAAPALAPEGWAASLAAARQRSEHRVRSATDMSIYELHVRDFSASDETVRSAWRGKFLAFTEPASAGMRHLKALAAAGITDVHLLPVFDIASIPETGCAVPAISASAAGAGDSAEPQAAVRASTATDCYNWGYDPLHYSAPEGSYATDASDGARRLIEFRQMVMALHDAGLRVGMDVVYNHTPAAGQSEQSVLDRIVPGYYQRLNAQGEVERSTCCANTATEHLMMGKMMSDSVLLWAQAHGIDSFRFDLMGHQPRDTMVAIQARLRAALGREVQLLGEGWNFGEVANGARFVQASQLSLGGTGIGSFSDRGRDALRGGGAGDSGEAMFSRQGWISGLFTDRNALAPPATAQDLMRSADLVRVGLAGTLRNYALLSASGEPRTLAQIDYAGQPAGYASQPAEVVNYVENHDNQTLYDSLAMKLPRATLSAERARVQTLAAAVVAFSQGVAYFHAGQEILRSKSLDRNSYDSGDWFNRLDWSGQTNHFGSGLPPEPDNGRDWSLLRPLLAEPALRPSPADIAFARSAFLDLLKIRASSSLFHLASAEAVSDRLRFFNTGPAQNPAVLVASLRGDLKGERLAGANFGEIVYFINVDKAAQTLQIDEFKGRGLVLHPVQRAPGAADARPAEARFDTATGRFTVPARTAVVWVAN